MGELLPGQSRPPVLQHTRVPRLGCSSTGEFNFLIWAHEEDELSITEDGLMEWIPLHPSINTCGWLIGS